MQRSPCASTKLQRCPSRSSTARLIAFGMWRERAGERFLTSAAGVDVDGVAGVVSDMSDAELEAEKVEQTRLEALAAAHLTPLASATGAARRAAENLRLYAEQTEAGENDRADSLAAQLSALIGKVVDETP